MQGDHLTPIEEIRREKLKKVDELRKIGINPYPYGPSFKIQPIGEIRELRENAEVSCAGRIFSIRTHGGISFADLKDQTNKIQLAFKKDNLTKDQKNIYDLLDASDYIEAEGRLFTTRAGELTIEVKRFNILSKALRPIPTKEDPLQDKEIRLRKRYLDLLTNPQSQQVFATRHTIVREIRKFLETKKMVEVETPVLQPLYGGANARPFTTHINTLDATAYLRIAPELYLKRLVVGGYEGVYEIARNFRNEGVDQTHYPEFTMLEAYVTYIDYQGMMNLMEEMLRHLSRQILTNNCVTVHQTAIDLSGEWTRIAMTDLIKDQLNIDVEKNELATLMEFAQKQNLEIPVHPSKGELAFLIFDKLIAHSLTSPTWVIDYPIEVSPLAKPHRSKPGFTERFELYIGGVELMDGWSELTDPIEQRQRFEAESYRDFDATETAQPVDEDFLESLEYGLPPFAGVGTGIDRLTMFFTNVWAIQETILFPFKKISQIEPANKINVEYKLSKDFSIQDQLRESIPGMFYAYTFLKDLEIDDNNPRLEQIKNQVVEQQKNISPAEIKKIASIQSYRQIIKLSGSDPDSHHASPEALLKRITQGKDLYKINTAVDAYNTIVVKTAIGLGGFDLDSLKIPVTLRYSNSGEKMNLLGKNEITQLKKNQIIYADQDKPITMDLNYRDINETKITTKTKNVILFADGGPGIEVNDVLSALKEASNLIHEFCGGTQDEIYLVK